MDATPAARNAAASLAFGRDGAASGVAVVSM
jgi:hypothetical protein